MLQIEKRQKKPVHWPTLNTVIMVEDTLKNMNESVISVAELKRKLPRQVNHLTLMVILEYLERSGKIAAGLRGISWVYTDSKVIRELIKKGTEI
ncbi:hypothetical protein HYS72_00330 [Candidatus Pacearchaeota archaeon]|nr:hypothetical protein [Candidatus Pacearchaeota archaeon]